MDRKILVIGGTNIDFICKAKSALVKQVSNLGENLMSYGGVGRNICENLGRLGLDVSFITSIGNDAFGKDILHELERLNIDTTHVFKNGIRTGSYISVLDDTNDMYISICDNEAVNELKVSYFEKLIDYINSFDFIVMDTNLSEEVLEYLLTNITKRVFIDATSNAKAVKLIPHLDKISFLKCNNQEANVLLQTENHKSHELLIRLLEKGIKQVVITSGAGEIYYNKDNSVFTVDAIKVDRDYIKSTTGCGDAFMSGMIYGMCANMTIHACVNLAKRLACQTLNVVNACNPDLKVD